MQLSDKLSFVNVRRPRGLTVAGSRRMLWQPSDILLLLSLLALWRQVFWFFSGSQSSNLIGWSFALLASSTSWYAFAAARDQAQDANDETFAADPKSILPWWRDRAWILLVVLPLLAYYFLRAPFPDFNFDQLNYHLINTERGLRGWPMIPGDFFPGTLLVNPAPDMVFGLARHVLGYRLGTFINLLSLWWVATLLDSYLRKYIRAPAVRYAAILFCLLTEHILFLVNLYMVDLLSLPLMMAAALRASDLAARRRQGPALIEICLYLGISIAFKLTNACFALPIILICLYQILKSTPKPSKTIAAVALLCLILPSVPFMLYLWSQTGNPVFPYYNGVFKSSLMVARNYRDVLHGPENFWQALTWPVISFIYPERLSAMLGMTPYSGRLAASFVVCLFAIFSSLISRDTKRLCLITVAAALFWSFASGDIRYGLFIEVIGGVIIVTLLTELISQAWTQKGSQKSVRTFFAVSLFVILLMVQTGTAGYQALMHCECYMERNPCDLVTQPVWFNKLIERNNTFNAPYQNYWKESLFFLRDRRAQSFFSEADKEQFRDVEIWVNITDATSGLEATVNSEIPMVSIAKFIDLFDYLEAAEYQRKVREIFEHNIGKRMYTLVKPYKHETALADIQRAQLGIKFGQITPVSIPFYSPHNRLNLLLVQILPNS